MISTLSLENTLGWLFYLLLLAECYLLITFSSYLRTFLAGLVFSLCGLDFVIYILMYDL